MKFSRPDLIVLLLCAATVSSVAEPGASSRSEADRGTDPERDRLRYSDRASLDPRYEKYLEAIPRFLANWQDTIRLPDPPANSSATTEAELKLLHALERERTPGNEERIRQEIEVAGMTLGPLSMGDLLAVGTKFPATRTMLETAQREMEILVFRFKVAFDRPRPTHLDPSLEPSIPVPGHPAYPSGHATQAHLLGFLLGEVDPAHADRYREDAAGIAKNREIAGVHYPSDSEAGRQLARQIVDRLLEIDSFRKLVESARAEHR